MGGKNGLDAAAEMITGDGVTYFLGDDHAGEVVGEFCICECAEHEVGTTLGHSFFARAGELRVTRHTVFSTRTHGFNGCG